MFLQIDAANVEYFSHVIGSISVVWGDEGGVMLEKSLHEILVDET